MNESVWVALLSFIGTLVGTFGGLIAAGRLTAYRLEQLETKLDAQGKTVAKIPVMEEKIHHIQGRISRLEGQSLSAETGDYC